MFHVLLNKSKIRITNLINFFLFSLACSASDADHAANGWFLHNNNSSSGAPAALYQRVRDLFHTRSPGPRVPAEGQEAPAMTGKRQMTLVFNPIEKNLSFQGLKS